MTLKLLAVAASQLSGSPPTHCRRVVNINLNKHCLTELAAFLLNAEHGPLIFIATGKVRSFISSDSVREFQYAGRFRESLRCTISTDS